MVRWVFSRVWIWALLWVALPAWASQGRLQLDADRLGVGQTGRLILHVVDGRPHGVPSIPSIDGLMVRYEGSATRFQMNNFSRTLVHSYEYRVTGLEPGEYHFGPFEVQLDDGSQVITNQVSLRVEPPQDAPAVALQATSGFDREEAYVGEVLIYQYSLVSTQRIMGTDWRLPDFEGLRRPQQGQAMERSYFVEDPDGERTTTFEGAIPLVATGTGDRSQPAALVQVRLPQGRSDLLGFRQYRTEMVAAEAAPLQVRPLPGPEPEGFSGLVGDFRLKADLQSERAAVGESVTWRLEVVGDGLLEGYKPPVYTDVAAAVYENDEVLRAWVEGGEYVVQGLWTRVVVPTEEGVLQLPPLRIVTFSPSRGEYVTHEVTVPPLQVTAGREVAGEMESFAAPLPEGAAPMEEALDFRPIYQRGPARVLPVSWAFTGLSALAALPGLWVAGGVARRRVQRWRSARQEAKVRPPTAREVLGRLPEGSEARLAAMENALRLALARIEGVELVDLDRRAAIEGLPEDLAARVRAASDALDRARFAGDEASDALEAEIIALVDALEAR